MGISPVLLHAAPPEVTWQDVADQSRLSAEERDGARFLSGHLEIDHFIGLSPDQQSTLLHYAAQHRHGNPPLALCWRPDTPATVIMAFRAAEQAGAEIRRRDRRPTGIATAFQADLANHWRTTAIGGGGQNLQGMPVTLTWSIVPDGTLIPGGQVSGEGSNEPSDLRAWLAGLYGGSSSGPAADQDWFPIIKAAFDNIASQTGIRYVYEPSDDGATLSNQASGTGVVGTRGDIRIAGHALDGNSNVLAYNYFPDFADMVIDTSDNFFNDLGNGSQRLRNVIEHEHGHGLGLDHVCPLDNTKLMEPYINLGFTGVQFDDIYTLQRLYGDPFESHGSESDNDSLARAASISTPVNQSFIAQWLGIDDNSDSDHFALTAPAGSQLTVRIIPSSANYLEGPQNIGGSCSSGTPFNSGILHDLTLEIIDSDLTTVLATAASAPAGSEELVDSLIINRADTYYLRITGGSADFNQLYRLEAEVNAPSIALRLGSVTLARELFQAQNGVPDPGETLDLEIGIESIGLLEATNINATLSLPPGSEGFTTNASYGDLPAGTNGSRHFIFAPAGECGEQIDLTLLVTADGGYTASLPLNLLLGAQTVFFDEDFDASGSLPAAWAGSTVKKGSGWSVVNTATHSAPNALFAANSSQAGQSTISSPTISINDSPGTLSFFHRYDTEAGYDGGVLEIKIGGENWQDITSSGAIFVNGGYNLALVGTQNPLGGRSGWSGDSGTFIETVVALPDTVVNQDVRFRWIIGHDARIGANGWFIDDVVYRNFICDESGVALTLSSNDTSASELANPADTAEITVSAVLPVTSDLPIRLETSGSASPATDLTGLGDLMLNSGTERISAILAAVNDGRIEGPESLRITSPDAAGTVDISLIDTPYATWAFSELGGTGRTLPFDDFDGDGSPNVEELIFGTDGSSPASLPVIRLVRNAGDFELPIALDTLPAGVEVDAESSSDLNTWSMDRVTRMENAFRLSGSGETKGFLRLLYRVPEFSH